MNHHVIATACVLTLSFGGVASASLSSRGPDVRCYDASKVELIAAWGRAQRDCIAAEGQYAEGCVDITRRGAEMMKDAEVNAAEAGDRAVCVRAGDSPVTIA
jgi:hypothetical protein